MVAGRSLGPVTIQFEDLVLLFFSPHSGHLSTPSEDKHQAGNGELGEGMNELTRACLCWSCEQVSSLQRGGDTGTRWGLPIWLLLPLQLQGQRLQGKIN